MTQDVHPGPAAYAMDRGPVGVLLIHGYTGSVAETRPMGEYLAARGLTVRCPLLPGHGTTPEDLQSIYWREWTDEVEASLADLRAHSGQVFIGGLSLGSLLTLWLGAHHPEVAGLIAMAPAVKVSNRLMPLTVAARHVLKRNPMGAMEDDLVDPEGAGRQWSYDELPLWGAGEVYLLQRVVMRALPSIRLPILIFQGRRDVHCAPDAAQILHDKIGSTDKRIVWLETSGHNILVDAERQFVWEESYRWIAQRATHEIRDGNSRA
ncbi:MAG: alpha/beta fold hydrolase [Anaerolineae bacterium]|nr:alpha/beta fold hydrolase [Anaerolineae bacterium]